GIASMTDGDGSRAIGDAQNVLGNACPTDGDGSRAIEDAPSVFQGGQKSVDAHPEGRRGGVPDAAPSSKCTLAQAEGKGTSQDFGDDDASEPQTTTAHVGGPRGPSDAQREDSPPRRLSSPTRFPCRALRARRRHRPPRPFRWPASRWPSRRGGDG